jgi:hypothetical protein
MSSETKRPLHLPPVDFASRDIPVMRSRPTRWLRLHSRTYPPIFYSPLAGNRFAVPNLGTLYLGRDARTCFLEKYGDEIYGARNSGVTPTLPAADWRARRLTSIAVPALKICDLTASATLAACGVDLGSLNCHELRYPQAWARAIMEHPAAFDAILYASRFTQTPCVAIYNRRSLKTKILNAHPLSSHPDGMKFLAEFQIALV